MDSVFESVGRPSRSLRPALSRGRSSCSPVSRLVRAWALILGTGPQSESSRAHGRGPRLPFLHTLILYVATDADPQRQVEPAAHLGPVDSSSRPWDSAGKTSPGPDRDHRSRRVGLHVPAYILSPKGFGGPVELRRLAVCHPFIHRLEHTPGFPFFIFSCCAIPALVQSLVPHHILLFLDSALHFHFAQIFSALPHTLFWHP